MKLGFNTCVVSLINLVLRGGGLISHILVHTVAWVSDYQTLVPSKDHP